MKDSSIDPEDLYQVALLIDQLKHDDIQFRIVALKNLTTIASALGQDRTRDELIPFLAECVEDEDEVTNVLADEIAGLASYVGGNEHVHVLFKPLEILLCGEDNEVREKALIATEDVVSLMDQDQFSNKFLPFISKLARKDWFTARSAAALLCHLAFGKVDKDKEIDLLGMFSQLSADVTPAVRRATIRTMPKVMQKLSPALKDKSGDLAQIFVALAKDEQDSIRIQAIQSSVLLSTFFSSELKTKYLLPALLGWAADRSWRVRWSLSHHITEIISIILSSNSSRSDAVLTILPSLCPVFDNLLNDAEPEVRAAAASHFFQFCKHTHGVITISRYLMSMQRLANDSSDFVRAVVAMEISKIYSLVSREDSVNILLPVLLTMLRDEKSDVRLNVIAHLSSINESMGIDFLSASLLPALIDLAQDGKWRVRLAVMEHIPMIGKQLGESFFTEQLINICVDWLHDRVFSVRRAAAVNMRQLAALFGEEWTANHILPKLMANRSQRGTSVASSVNSNSNVTISCHQRLTMLHVHLELLEIFSSGRLCNSIFKLVIDASNDTVANVRLAVAKILLKEVEKNSRGFIDNKSDVLLTLNKLSNDGDRDVRFYATKALKLTQLYS